MGLPEFPPSSLICSIEEWDRAFNDGRVAATKGVPCTPPTDKTMEPWISGWKSVNSTMWRSGYATTRRT